jgi:hypothetical protein
VNRSSGLWGVVPAGVVTAIVTVPAPGGLIAVICESDTTLNLAEGVGPKETLVAPVNPDP